VTLFHDAGATVDCIDSCSNVEVAVTGAAAQSGPLSRDALLERLRGQGYRDAVTDRAGVSAAGPGRPCSLRPPSGRGSVTLVSDTGADYVLRVDGG
jgi:hypothetical protein